jgi:hypothetical protein
MKKQVNERRITDVVLAGLGGWFEQQYLARAEAYTAASRLLFHARFHQRRFTG